jgi:hypothetical protein
MGWMQKMPRSALILVILFFASFSPLSAVASRPNSIAASTRFVEPKLIGSHSRTAQTGETRLYLPVIARPPGVTSDLRDGWYGWSTRHILRARLGVFTIRSRNTEITRSCGRINPGKAG